MQLWKAPPLKSAYYPVRAAFLEEDEEEMELGNINAN